MGRDGAGWFADFLEQQRDRGANYTDQDTEPESVDIAEQRTLLLKDVIENCERFFRRRPVAGVARKSGLEMSELLLKVEIELRHVPDKIGLARLCLTGDQCRDRRNADASTDIAHQIENASGVAHLFLAERPHGRCGHGHIH